MNQIENASLSHCAHSDTSLSAEEDINFSSTIVDLYRSRLAENALPQLRAPFLSFPLFLDHLDMNYAFAPNPRSGQYAPAPSSLFPPNRLLLMIACNTGCSTRKPHYVVDSLNKISLILPNLGTLCNHFPHHVQSLLFGVGGRDLVFRVCKINQCY